MLTTTLMRVRGDFALRLAPGHPSLVHTGPRLPAPEEVTFSLLALEEVMFSLLVPEEVTVSLLVPEQTREVRLVVPDVDYYSDAGSRGFRPSPSSWPSSLVRTSVERGSTAGESELINRKPERSLDHAWGSQPIASSQPAPTQHTTIQLRQNLTKVPAGITRDRTHVHAHTRLTP